MALTEFTKNMDIIAALDDYPNDVDGLTAAQLKAKFDEGGKALQTYLNDTLLPQLEALGVEAVVCRRGTGLAYLRLDGGGALEASADGEDWLPAGTRIAGPDGQLATPRGVLQFADGQVLDSGGRTVVSGLRGPQGETGPAWYPSVDGAGVLTFSQSTLDTAPPPVSIRGPQGPAGQDGNSFVVRSRYDSLEALQTAHPAGQAGDAYAVGTAAANTVYIWDADRAVWADIGALQGPAGPQGAAGPPGADGAAGSPGPAGQSAYAAAVAGGYTGTETAFQAALAAVEGKADRAASPTAGHLAALDGQGNVTDAGAALGSLASRVTPAAAGNFAALGSDGNLTDSGYGPAAFAAANLTADQIPYDDTDTDLGADDLQAAVEALFTSVSEGKALIAAAVADRGGSAAAADTFSQLAAAIAAIPASGEASMTGVTVSGGSYQINAGTDKYLYYQYSYKGMAVTAFYLVEEGYVVAMDGTASNPEMTLSAVTNGFTVGGGASSGIVFQGDTVSFAGSLTVYRFAA